MALRNIGSFPFWKLNLCLFALLFSGVIFSFYIHNREVTKIFLYHAREDAITLAELVRVNTETGILAEKIIEDTTSHFLGNLASFLDYLDDVEPFLPQELYMFVLENHLAGVYLIRKNGKVIEVPEYWVPENFKCRKKLTYVPRDNLFLYCASNLNSFKELILGVRIPELESLYEKTSPEGVLLRLSKLPHIKAANIINKKTTKTEVVAKNNYFEAYIPFKNKTIHVIFKSYALRLVEEKLHRNYLILVGLISVIGVFFTIIFYLLQRFYLQSVQEYERALAKEREEAALGRAAATIAHEIRNPLNTISLALQRLMIESKNLTPEDRKLLDLVRQSLLRANRPIEQLLKYARLEKQIKKEKFNLKELVQEILELFQEQIKKKNIKLKTELNDIIILADKSLIYQVVENIFLNALEAIDKEGSLLVELFKENGFGVLKTTNSGELPPEDKLQEIFNPYVTFKVKGTGLGLALVKKIVEAHGGRVTAKIVSDTSIKKESAATRYFQIEIRLPVGEER
ncbi:sensor histidine kinase [Thermodesulfatator atlanticus]